MLLLGHPRSGGPPRGRPGAAAGIGLLTRWLNHARLAAENVSAGSRAGRPVRRPPVASPCAGGRAGAAADRGKARGLFDPPATMAGRVPGSAGTRRLRSPTLGELSAKWQ